MTEIAPRIVVDEGVHSGRAVRAHAFRWTCSLVSSPLASRRKQSLMNTG